MPWFKKNKVLSNCKTEADIIAISSIRTSLRTALRSVRNSIPDLDKDVDTYQTILDEENILINLFCNKQKSPIDRNVDYSGVVEDFRKFLHNIAKPCSAEQATANKPTEPVTEPATKPAAEPITEPVIVTEPATKPAAEPVIATEPATEPVTEPVTEPATEPAAEPATKPATEPVTEPTEPVTEPAAEPVTEPTEPVTEPVIATEPTTEPSVEPGEDRFTKLFSELTSETTMTKINNVMNRYNIHYIGIGMDEFINFCKEVYETIVIPISKNNLSKIGDEDKKIIDRMMIEIFQNIARKSRNTIISTIQMIAHDHGMDPFISLYSTGEIFVQFNGDSFTIRPDAKHDDPILIDRRGKIIIQSKTTKEYYYIPLKVKDNNKNVLNTRALTELLVNGSESIIKQNIDGNAPYYIKDMYDEQTKAIVPIFNFGSLPTNLSNERKRNIIELIYRAIPKIAQDLGGLTAITSLIDIKDDRIILHAVGKNGSCNYDLGFESEKAQVEVVDTAPAAEAIPENTSKVDPKPEDPPMSAKKSSSNKKKKKPEQTTSTEPTSSAEEPSSNPQENASADDASADNAAG